MCSGVYLMDEYPDLEISLHKRGQDSYEVEFRYKQPGSHADIRPESGKVLLSSAEFSELAYDQQAYAQALTGRFFADPLVLRAFEQARNSAAALGAPLRVRLLLNPADVQLQSLRWELLCDPKSGYPLSADEQLYFSRFPTSDDWHPVKLGPMSQLRALVVAANPSGLDDYQLPNINVEIEINLARKGLGTIPSTTLPDAPGEKRATLRNILDTLQEGGYDILYLIAHGTLANDEPWVWLEDEAGNVARISGDELVRDMNRLRQRPELVVLAVCDSAGTDEGSALTALGPRLAEAGIPAVLAMQGKISMATVSQFMPVFFNELQRDGQVDRAVTIARARVSKRVDYWMPVLFTRLRGGNIWLTPGFSGELKQWPSLIRAIGNGKCTPILGPGLFESLLGSQREIAQQWAQAVDYPLQPYTRESLPQVAQYLTVEVFEREPYEKLEESLIQSVRKLLPESSNGTDSLQELLELAWIADKQRDQDNPYSVLAQLPMPVFITTNLNNLLELALREAGKDPQVMLCPWNDSTITWDKEYSIYRREKDYQPSPQRPLVYCLFGSLNDQDTIVLTEDDYFDFLIGVTRNRDSIPAVVRRALADSALLFLGFQLDDWQFRVLFRSILAQQGSERRRSYPHVAAQIAPDKSYNLNPEAARRYLEKYFLKSAEISIYWGSVKYFIKDLHYHWNNRTV